MFGIVEGNGVQHLNQFLNQTTLIAIFNIGRCWLRFDSIARRKSFFIINPTLNWGKFYTIAS